LLLDTVNAMSAPVRNVFMRAPSQPVINFFKRHVTQFEGQVEWLVKYFEDDPEERQTFMKQYEDGKGYFGAPIQEAYFARAAERYGQGALFIFFDSSSNPYLAVASAQRGEYSAPREILSLKATTPEGKTALWKNLQVPDITFSKYYMSVYTEVYKSLREPVSGAPKQKTKMQEYDRLLQGYDRLREPVSGAPKHRTKMQERERRLARMAQNLRERSQGQGGGGFREEGRGGAAQREEQAKAAESRRDGQRWGNKSKFGTTAPPTRPDPSSKRKRSPEVSRLGQSQFASESISVDGDRMCDEFPVDPDEEAMRLAIIHSIRDEEERQSRQEEEERQEAIQKVKEFELREETQEKEDAIRRVEEYMRREK
jgi:hypothetical protein